MASFYVGLSGFSYPTWKGEDRFYPADVPNSKFLQYYATRYKAVEMDGTFYRNPSEKNVSDWIAKTPAHFKFSFKMHQRVTHLTRLKPESIEAVRFFVKELVPMAKEDRLGPILIQLPPNFKRNDERLATFLEQLPQDMRGIEKGSAHEKLRYGVEFRNESWNHDDVEAILRQYGVGWVASDMDNLDAQRRDTGLYIHARLRKESYGDDALLNWANYFSTALAQGKDCYVYCKHEDLGSPWIWADFLLKNVKEN